MDSISVKNLTKSYKKTSVLKDVSFTIPKGSVYALLGGNGAGKTTTVMILSTLLNADKGTVKIAGYDLKLHPKEVRRHISLTGQYAAVDDILTGMENMLMIGALSRVSATTTRARTTRLLRQFDLEKAANNRVSTYSGGMRRKLDLAISLLAEPSIIFLDEPTTGLDPRSRQELWNVIRSLVKNGTTILLTTQYLEEADALADTIGVLHNGRIVAEGTPTDLKRQIGSEYIELVFNNETLRKDAQALLHRGEVSAETALSLLVPVTNPVAELPKILAKLSHGHLVPSSLSIRKPTLDDVFMKLTDTTEKEDKR